MTAALTEAGWAGAWQASWDRQQEGYMPDRELRIDALLDVVEAVTTTSSPLVLDLACGTGSITARLLRRFPGARSIALDVDPALLAIASATFATDDRVRLVRADLRDPGWLHALPERSVDVVLTATALHWIQEGDLRRLYRDLADVVRVGGAFAHAEDMPLADAPRLAAALGEVEQRRRDRVRSDGRPDWDGWWDEVARDPQLAEAAAERTKLFGGNHAPVFLPAAGWHVTALGATGFAEAEVVWRQGAGAVVAALR